MPCTTASFRRLGGTADKYEGSMVRLEPGSLNDLVREPLGEAGRLRAPTPQPGAPMARSVAAAVPLTLRSVDVAPLRRLLGDAPHGRRPSLDPVQAD
jgi:hypothetical protein